MIRNRQHILKDHSGVAIIEFALVLPILLLLVYGALELTRFAIAQQKVDKVTFAMSDLVTQNLTNTDLEAKLARYSDAALKIIAPFPFEGTIIFSSISGRPTGPGGSSEMWVNWQRCYKGADRSKIGAEDTKADMPDDYQVLQNQDVILVEVFFNYEPLIQMSRALLAPFSTNSNVTTRTGILLYKTSIFKPRQGQLTASPAGSAC